MPLQALQQVDEEKAEDTQRDHGRGVLHPRLLHILPHAGKPVDQGLQGAEDRVKEGPLALKHVVHEDTQRLGDGKHDQKEHQNLQPT